MCQVTYLQSCCCVPAAQMAAQELSCLPFLGPGRPRAAGPTVVERVRTLAAGPPGLPPAAQPVGLTPGLQMPHITLHTVQARARAARVQCRGYHPHPGARRRRPPAGAPPCCPRRQSKAAKPGALQPGPRDDAIMAYTMSAWS